MLCYMVVSNVPDCWIRRSNHRQEVMSHFQSCAAINTHKWLFHCFETVLCPTDKPHNPMVNAGAIVCTSLIKVRCTSSLQLEV